MFLLKRFVAPVKNVAANPAEAWQPDKKEMAKVKKKAVEKGLTKIGNIHSHTLPKNLEGRAREAFIEKSLTPSETDLAFARKFNDTVRGVIVVDSKAIYGIKFHDKFGNEINVHVYDEGGKKW